MPDAVIENPILNSAFSEPMLRWAFGDDGITSETVEGRRVSSYFMPVPASRRSSQLEFETEWTRDRIEEKVEINRRHGDCLSTGRLDRERPLFFCQIEALETAIYLTEVAAKDGQTWIENDLRRFAEDANPGLFRIAMKMATGSGKTVVMAMLIAWQALKTQANRQDSRFSDCFLLVAPGITIRDRLRVLLPQDPDNYYRARDVVAANDLDRLAEARIVITNFHAFQQREKVAASKTTKQLLAQGRQSPFVETPDQMVRRVCRESVLSAE